MGTGQLLITVAAMFLLSLVVLNVNGNFVTTNSVMMETKFNVLATSLASSIIEEATSKAFDHFTDTNYVTTINGLTTSGNLGPEAGEVYQNFNDFDDFDNYSYSTQTDTTLISAYFDINCSVDYVVGANPEQVSSSATWHKRLSVIVSSPSMNDTIRLSSVFSYWFFR